MVNNSLVYTHQYLLININKVLIIRVTSVPVVLVQVSLGQPTFIFKHAL